jgi:hypothetical protein
MKTAYNTEKILDVLTDKYKSVLDFSVNNPELDRSSIYRLFSGKSPKITKNRALVEDICKILGIEFREIKCSVDVVIKTKKEKRIEELERAKKDNK